MRASSPRSILVAKITVAGILLGGLFCGIGQWVRGGENAILLLYSLPFVFGLISYFVGRHIALASEAIRRLPSLERLNSVTYIQAQKLEKTLLDLRKSEHLFHAIFELAPIPCLFFTDRGIIDCNDAAVKILEAKDKRELFFHHPAFFSPETQPDGRKSKEKAEEMDVIIRAKGLHQFEWLHRTLYGQEIPVEVTVRRMEIDDKELRLVLWRDLRKEKESAKNLAGTLDLLRSREEMFRGIFENSPVGIVQVDFGLNYISGNLAFLNFLGYSDAEMRTRTLADVTHPEDRGQSWEQAEVLASAGSVNLERRYLHRNGSVLWARVKTRALTGKSGESFFLFIIEDITAAKAQQEEMAKMQVAMEMEKAKTLHSAKLASLGEMSAGIAHEINNPLTIIEGTVRSLSKHVNEPETFKKKLEAVERAVGRAAKIVTGLRKFARSSDQGEKRRHSLKKIIGEVLVLVDPKSKRHSTPIEVICATDAFIHCDDIEMEQVLINLINNGIDAVIDKEDRWLKLTVTESASEVVLQIRDSGKGMPRNVADKLFQPFFTTKTVGKGTGLGLSIVKGILDEHGATIRILDNDPNTCFEIKFKKRKEEGHAGTSSIHR